MILIERGQRCLHLSCPFLPFEPLGRCRIAGGDFLSAQLASPFDRNGWPCLSKPADGKVKRDSIEPRVKRRGAMERIQL